MLEKMKSVSNPLTIIGLFCGVVEVAGLIVMGTGNLAPEAQRDLIWLVKWFPIVLVSLFFVTLWFKDRVLYAPGDFKDEKNYLTLVNAKHGLDIETIQLVLSEAKTEIVKEVMKAIPTNGTDDKTKVEAIINEKLQPVQDIVDDVKSEIYDNYLRTTSLLKYGDDIRRNAIFRVWRTLNHVRKPLTVSDIANVSLLNGELTTSVLIFLVGEGLVTHLKDESGAAKFVLANPPSKAQ
jgi:hypothetical protein